MNKSILTTVLSIFIGFSAVAQSDSDMLENALTSVVTVGVAKSELGNMVLGYRGDLEDEAYAKMLDLTGMEGSGSGFIIERNGKKYVVTNAHVIQMASDESGSIFVYDIARNQIEVKVVGGDSFYDLAVLEFVDSPGLTVSATTFSKKSARIGQKVYAIGNPLGEFPYSISDGIISAKNRVRNHGVTGKFGFLQSTATVIWGNSGGPLINTSGEVVGVNSQIHIVERMGQAFVQPQINFALEAEIAERLVNDIIDNDGFVLRAYLGAEFKKTFVADYFANMYVPTSATPMLTGVLSGSPSEKSLSKYIGLQVKAVNGELTASPEELLGELEKVRPGQSVEFTFVDKSGVELKATVKTEELKSSQLEVLANHVFDKDFLLKPKEKSLDMNYNKNPYQILAAGYFESNEDNLMWRVTKMSDLGAALRINGLSGVVHLAVFDQTSQNTEIFTKSISGQDDTITQALWY